MKTYRKIVIIVSIIIGIFVTIWTRFYSQEARIAFDPSLPELDREYLKNIALDFAEGKDPILDEGISAEYEVYGDTFKVIISQDVKDVKNFYTLIATFPVTKEVYFEKGILKGTFLIEYDNGSYNYYGDNRKPGIIRNCILVVLVLPFCIFLVLDWFPNVFIELAKSTKRKERQIEDSQ